MKKTKAHFLQLGASNHSPTDRHSEDFYATPRIAIESLINLESFDDVLEPSCGKGHISEVLKEYNIKTESYDLINRGYGNVKDFFTFTSWDGDIITNPPYKHALSFVEHAINIVKEKRKIAMFLKIQFLESKKRKEFFKKHPPRKIYVSSSRISCAKNGDWDVLPTGNSAICYAWFVWEKDFAGETIIEWFN